MGPQAHGLPRAEIAGRLLRLHGCSFEPWRSGERTRAAAEGCRPGNEISYRASGRRIEAARQAETASRAQSRATSAEDRSGSSSHAWNRAASCSADGIAEKPTQDISQGEIEWQKKTHSNRMDRPEAEEARVLQGLVEVPADGPAARRNAASGISFAKRRFAGSAWTKLISSITRRPRFWLRSFRSAARSSRAVCLELGRGI